jgi:hypothetical protein
LKFENASFLPKSSQLKRILFNSLVKKYKKNAYAFRTKVHGQYINISSEKWYKGGKRFLQGLAQSVLLGKRYLPNGEREGDKKKPSTLTEGGLVYILIVEYDFTSYASS